ncbi:pilin [Thiotrichales bacterium 19S3-7]|nr:pilin [Thiotrichales bacterium 19S3-7]MCF6802940.1 pilin [Thiotrichales bacterium 19S3-11]
MIKLLHKEHGFSYIEATMITAIIGIVAAISIPAYMAHLDRAKLAEAYTLLSSKQDDVVSQMISTGSLDKSTLNRFNTADAITSGKYGNVSFSHSGVITYTFTDKKLAGNSISLTPKVASDGTTNWLCQAQGDFPSNPCSPFD